MNMEKICSEEGCNKQNGREECGTNMKQFTMISMWPSPNATYGIPAAGANYGQGCCMEGLPNAAPLDGCHAPVTTLRLVLATGEASANIFSGNALVNVRAVSAIFRI